MKTGWLDFSRDFFSIYVAKKDILVKFLYEDVVKVHGIITTATMQLKLERIPQGALELLEGEYTDISGIAFDVEFGVGNIKVCNSKLN